MTFIQFILDHKKEISFMVLGVHAAAVHFYIAVAHAGGYRTLWRNFQGPETVKKEEQK